MRRTISMIICSLLLAAGLSATTVRTAPPAAAAADPDAPGMIWGAYPFKRPGENEWQALKRARSSAERELGATRRFYLWDHDVSFPGPVDQDLIRRGSKLVVAIKPELRSGAGIPWSRVANAQPGDSTYQRMRSWARKFRDLDVPVYVTFNHEPEAKVNNHRGTSSEYIQAWRQFVRVFRREGADNVRFLWIMTDYSFMVPSSDRRAAAKWYPGDDWVEGIAADSYNWYRCRSGLDTPWMSLRQIIEPQRQFWLDHQSEELWLTEFGTVEDARRPGRKAAWFDDARALFKTPTYSVFDGVVLFEDKPGHECNWAPDTSSSARAAWARWGNDPYYKSYTLPVHQGAEPAEPPAADGQRVAVVTDDPARLRDDTALVRRLRSQGYRVTLHDDSTVQPAYVRGAAAVLITQEISQGQLGARLRGIASPVVVWKPSLFGEMGLTPGGENGNGSRALTKRVNVVEPAHPLAPSAAGRIQVATERELVPIGTPADSADVVAKTQWTPTLFAYHRGDRMVGLNAPGCRVAAPLPADGIGSLTNDGLDLLDSVVTYAVRGCS